MQMTYHILVHVFHRCSSESIFLLLHFFFQTIEYFRIGLDTRTDERNRNVLNELPTWSITFRIFN